MPSKTMEHEYYLPKSKARCRVADRGSDLAVIVTHPWGPLGGNMHNNVVTAASLYFQRLGVTTLRMDFAGSQIGRGNAEVGQVVEASEFLLNGRHLRDDGDEPSSSSAAGAEGEGGERRRRRPATAVDDDRGGSAAGGTREEDGRDPRMTRGAAAAEAATDDGGAPGRARRRRRPSRSPASILLVGYSYGSLIAASASADVPQCVGVVSIAPPISVKHWLLMFNAGHHVRRARKREGLPRLMVMGSEDDFTSSGRFHEFVESFPAASTTGAELKGANHFFGGRERDLMNVIGTWLLGAYPSVIGSDLKKLGCANFSGYAAPSDEDLKTKRSEDTKGTDGKNLLSSMLGGTVCACMT